MDTRELEHLMMAEGLNILTESTSWNWETRVYGFGYGFELCGRDRWNPCAETHHISFDDSKVFKEMTKEQVIAEIDKVRQELLLKIHFHRYFKKFCTMSLQEQARSYKSFLEWSDKEPSS